MDTQALETVDLAGKLGRILLDRGLTISTAESCTAGGIGAAIASVDGASSWYLGGVVTYATDLKRTLLKVSDATISGKGVVSRETVIEMCRGVMELTGSGCAISISGYVGTTGGDAYASNGTVWMCFCVRETDPVTKRITVTGTRRDNLRMAVMSAIKLALAGLEG